MLSRLRLAVPFAVAVLAACGAKAPTAPCESASPPPECTLTCDPLPGAPVTCPGGFHCSVTGMCTQLCTPGGGECGASAMCTTDGRCVPTDVDADTTAPDADCPDVTFSPTRVIPTVQFVIDKSGSMTNDFGGVSRYDAVESALVSPTGVVTELAGSVYFGASLYDHGGACPNLIANDTGRALNNFTSIESLLANNAPGSGTPTGESLEAAVNEMVANPPPAGSPPIIVLATDGEPDLCADGGDETGGRARSVEEAQAAFAAGIQVFVLSVGSDVANEHLQAVANAGSGLAPDTMPPAAAPFYVANNQAALTAAFDEIIGGVITCELELDGNIDPAQAGTGTVTLNGGSVPFGTGWEVVDSNTIRLIGSACDTLLGSADPVVSASFPCGAIID